MVFVGTKRQAKEAVEREAGRCHMPFVAERWLGGTLTNYRTIRDRLKRLQELEAMWLPAGENPAKVNLPAHMKTMVNPESGKLDLTQRPRDGQHPQLQQEDGRHAQPRAEQDPAQLVTASAT